MSTDKTSVSVYRLRTGMRAAVEAQFADRTVLQNGLDGWFHLLPPSDKVPQWVDALAPYVPRQSLAGIRSAVQAALVLVCRQGVDYLLSFGFAWMHLEDIWLEPEFGPRALRHLILLPVASYAMLLRRWVDKLRERWPEPIAVAPPCETPPGSGSLAGNVCEEATTRPGNKFGEAMRGLETLPLRYRKPYNSRHSFISWRLMVGHNRLLVAQEAGHSVSTMERAYAAWIMGAKPQDIERIEAAMAGRPLADSDDEDRTITSKGSNAPRLAATV